MIIHYGFLNLLWFLLLPLNLLHDHVKCAFNNAQKYMTSPGVTVSFYLTIYMDHTGDTQQLHPIRLVGIWCVYASLCSSQNWCYFVGRGGGLQNSSCSE